MDPQFEALLFSENDEVDFCPQDGAEELSAGLKSKLKDVLSLLIEQHRHIQSPLVEEFTKCLGWFKMIYCTDYRPYHLL
jgi:hypothetical protein